MRRRFGIKIGDILLMALILLSALILLFLPFLKDRAAYAEIVIIETGEVRRISLDKDAEYDISSRGVRLTVSVSDGSVSVSHSDCPDGICKDTPPASRAGQSIVCLPAGVLVKVCGEEATVDGVSG